MKNDLLIQKQAEVLLPGCSATYTGKDDIQYQIIKDEDGNWDVSPLNVHTSAIFDLFARLTLTAA